MGAWREREEREYLMQGRQVTGALQMIGRGVSMMEKKYKKQQYQPNSAICNRDKDEERSTAITTII